MKRIYKINYPQQQFSALLADIKKMEIGKLLIKVKEFFESENELGLNINSTLTKIDSLNKNDVSCLREFLFLAKLNFISIYRTPRVGQVKLHHWTAQPLIEKCEVGSLLLTKNFYIFYEDSSLSDTLSTYKIVTEINYDTLTEPDLNINSFFKYKDKYVFSPYSHFVVKSISKETGTTVIELEYVNNVEYLKYYFGQNLLSINQNFTEVFKRAIDSIDEKEKKASPMVDYWIISNVRLNYQRILGLKAYS